MSCCIYSNVWTFTLKYTNKCRPGKESISLLTSSWRCDATAWSVVGKKTSCQTLVWPFLNLHGLKFLLHHAIGGVACRSGGTALREVPWLGGGWFLQDAVLLVNRLFPQAGRLWAGVLFPKHCHVNETPISFPTTWGTQRRWPVVLENAITYLTIKMAKKELLVTCDSMVPSGSGVFDHSLFSSSKGGNRNTLNHGDVL